MIRKRTLIAKALFFFVVSFVFSVFLLFLSPRYSFLGKLVSARDMALLITRYDRLPEFTLFDKIWIIAFIFIVFAIGVSTGVRAISRSVRHRIYAQTETALFNDFIARLRFCYQLEDIISIVQEELEYRADCAVIIANTETNHVVYNSSARFVSNPTTYNLMMHRFSIDWTWFWADGLYFFDSDLGLVSNFKKARGLFVAQGVWRFFLICRFIRNVEPEIFPILVQEFRDYMNRARTLAKLLHYSQLSQEWRMVAQTQSSFLPQEQIETASIQTGAFFKPLVNVSGDYYDVIPINDDKTLLVVGDVSGKGLAAALVMGVVINTIKIVEKKENLEDIIYAVDMAIKRMQLLDKYTVLFLGLVDTQAMKIRYVNASMESPMILTKSADTYKVKTLESNCSVVGILDLDTVVAEEKPLYHGDVILMVSDGVPEVVGKDGKELGATDLYLDTIKTSAHKNPLQMAEDIANLAFNYSATGVMRDDITILAAKIKR